MEEVTRDEFYKFINPLDAVVSCSGDYGGEYPYKSYFKTRLHQPLGEIHPVLNEFGRGKHPIEKKYFIKKGQEVKK